MAGPTGFEPATSSVTGKRSNQLSYGPTWGKNEQQDWASQVHRGADSNRKRRIQQGFERYNAFEVFFVRRFRTQSYCSTEISSPSSTPHDSTWTRFVVVLRTA